MNKSIAAEAKSKGERTFTEKQVEKIIGERLARERRNSTGLSKVRDLLMGLVGKGIIKARNIPDMASELIFMLSGKAEKSDGSFGEGRAASESGTSEKAESEDIADGSSDAKIGGDEKQTSGSVSEYAGQAMPPKDGAVMNPKGSDGKEESPSADGAESEEKAEAIGNSSENDRTDEIIEFMKVFPGIDLEELLSDEDFLAFAEEKSGRLCGLYAAYIKSTGEKLRLEAEKRKELLRSGLSSTGFSARRSGAEDYSSLLSPNQMEIARSSGMSYREYADYLSQLPKKQ